MKKTRVVNDALSAFVAQKESADCQVLQSAQCGGGKEACNYGISPFIFHGNSHFHVYGETCSSFLWLFLGHHESGDVSSNLCNYVYASE
jgi:hypothetical protein